MHQIGSIHLQIIDVEAIYLHSLGKKRKQAHIHHSTLEVGYGVFLLRNGVVGLDDFHTIHAKVERKDEAYVVHRNLHTHLFGSISRDFLHRPVLYRRQVNGYGE